MGLADLADPVGMYSAERSRLLPVLDSLVRPRIMSPERNSFGVSPAYAASCFAGLGRSNESIFNRARRKDRAVTQPLTQID